MARLSLVPAVLEAKPLLADAVALPFPEPVPCRFAVADLKHRRRDLLLSDARPGPLRLAAAREFGAELRFPGPAGPGGRSGSLTAAGHRPGLAEGSSDLRRGRPTYSAEGYPCVSRSHRQCAASELAAGWR